MPQGPFTESNIPDAIIDAVEGLARAGNPPPTSVTRTRQANGLWSITAVYGPAEPQDAQERPHRGTVPENDFEDQGPTAPPPQPGPVGLDKIPTVSPGWAKSYTDLWQSMSIRPESKKTAEAIARQIVANQGRYTNAVSGTTVPWWFIAVLHAMECSLKFTQHLHNGDPLTARTVNDPKDRPPFGVPPFTWEESARDAICYERLDKVSDWSLPSVLYHWHRYNGINNEYKVRGIPTPYLWSGTPYYHKGKYVADHKFDAEAVSGQVGAAVLLRTLIDLKALSIDQKLVVQGNPAAAAQHVASLAIDTSGNAFQHIAAELDCPRSIASVVGRDETQRRAVKRLQEWLNIHGFVTPIDSDIGHSTWDQLKAFQAKSGREQTGQLDAETWSLLTAPMRRALAAIDHGTSSSLEDAVVRVACQHIDEMPTEVGGNNRGPWVRLYMNGEDGTSQKWCAGFVCFVIAQAARDLGIPVPFLREVGVDALVRDARANGRFIAETDIANVVQRRSKLHPGCIFVVRAEAHWSHTGFVLAVNNQTFDTLEGNTGGEGGTDGPNAKQGNRSFAKKDFLRLV